MGDSSAAIFPPGINHLEGSGGPKEEGDTKGLFQKTPRKDLTGQFGMPERVIEIALKPIDQQEMNQRKP